MTQGTGGGRPPQTFEEMAVAQGLLTPEQLEDCRRVQQNVVAQGLECNLEEVLLKKGLVTRAQAMAIHAALGRGNKSAVEGYEILSKLGAGGQGAVYKAKQSSMDRFVALKVLLPKFAKEKDGVQRFLREAKAVARLNHPNIVSGIDAGFSNGIYYYVMEYLDGESLEKRLAREGKLSWTQAVPILRQMASALEHARQNGLIHRDIKPANILLARDGTAKLADLGLARFAGGDGMNLTVTGFIVGTPYYMAPEQARGGENVDIRADLYSLGITFYEMLAGKPPYTGTDPLVVLNKHLHETVRFNFSDVPPEILAVGHRLTERDRARRYATPAQVIEDLDAFEKGQAPLHAKSAVRPKTARVPPAAPPRAKSPLPLILGGVAGVAVLAAVAAVAFSGKPDPVPPPPPERRPAPAAAAPAAPTPPRPAPNPADAASLEALTLVRKYQKANPDDLEEIDAQYQAAAAKAAGTAYEEALLKGAQEARAALLQEIAGRQKSILAAVELGFTTRNYAAGFEALDRNARAFRTGEWKDWISQQRASLEAHLARTADALRAASAAAESKGDREGALAPLRELAALGVPALARESADRIEKLEAARRAAAAEMARKLEAERARVEAFLPQADAWAAARAYEKIDSAAPALECEPARDELRNQLALHRSGREVLEAARRHALSLAGKPVSFTTKAGLAINGLVEVVQEQPVRMLVGGKAWDFADLSSRSVAAFYREARKGSAKPEDLAAFAILDGDGLLADEILAKSPVELGPRARKILEGLPRAVAKKAEPPAPARKPPEAREIVVYASELPPAAFGVDFRLWDDPTSPGGKLVGIQNDGDPIGPPPDPDASAQFKVPVVAGVPYRCWVRMKVGRPRGNSPANLIFVQFTGAVDKAGNEIFTLGTREVIPIRAPAREGWVWAGRDLTDPRSTEPVIYFRSTGEVTVGVSAGMEGVGFDQFILSPKEYFAKPPAEAVAPKPRK